MTQIGTPAIFQNNETTLDIEADGSAETEVYDIYIDDGAGFVLIEADVPATETFPDLMPYVFANIIPDGFTVGVIGKAVGFTDSEMSTVAWTSTVFLSGNYNTGAATEDAATNTTSGTLTITDPGNTAQYRTRNTTGTYGSFTLGTNGVWTYTLNNSDPCLLYTSDAADE